MRTEAPGENSVSISEECDQESIQVFWIDSTFDTPFDMKGSREQRHEWSAIDQTGNMTRQVYNEYIMTDVTQASTVGLPGTTRKASLPGEPFTLDADLNLHWSINHLETIVPGEEPGEFTITWMTMESVYADHLRWISCLKWSNRST